MNQKLLKPAFGTTDLDRGGKQTVIDILTGQIVD
jgi:hypothetical protein